MYIYIYTFLFSFQSLDFGGSNWLIRHCLWPSLEFQWMQCTRVTPRHGTWEEQTDMTDLVFVGFSDCRDFLFMFHAFKGAHNLHLKQKKPDRFTKHIWSTVVVWFQEMHCFPKPKNDNKHFETPEILAKSWKLLAFNLELQTWKPTPMTYPIELPYKNIKTPQSMILPTYPGKVPQTSPFTPHKERNSCRNCWWRVRGIFQGYVGEILYPGITSFLTRNPMAFFGQIRIEPS